jgi:hypothetical protein
MQATSGATPYDKIDIYIYINYNIVIKIPTI